MVKKAGLTTIGARNFLVAYNINLNTTSTRRANAIAFDIREAGRTLREGDAVTGKPVLDEQGEPVRIPGSLKSVKGIGWFIEEYGIAQLSLNLTDISVTPVHIAFEEACKKAADRGIRVTGSELVGLIPLQSMLDAADYFLTKQERSLGIAEDEKIKIAIKSLGLADLAPFHPSEKIIEYVLAKKMGTRNRLVSMSAKQLADETASESPAPGGGSVSAYVGALGASLGVMVANLSSHKRGWDDRWKFFSDVAERGMAIQKELLRLVDEDTHAFNQIMEAFALPKSTPEEKTLRAAAIESASKYAMEIPLRTAELALSAMDICWEMVNEGNPNSVTDAGVGALCIRAAVLGAVMNVKINAAGIKDIEFTTSLIEKAKQLEDLATKMETKIREKVELAF
jgi:glutamate formiminotransferase/formiminotetrahydrofolate cyclodeaminase